MWDQRYSNDEFAYGTEPNDFLRDVFDKIPKGGKVLCLAEGEGRNAVFLAKQGYQVTAVDQSPVGLVKANNFAIQNAVKINTVVADLNDFDFGQQAWDGIVSISAHVPPALRKKIHRQVVQSLHVGGVFILEAYTKQQLEMEGVGGPPNEEMLMSFAELNHELKGLSFDIGQEVKRHISEGQYHQGQSAVVQIVAHKAKS